MTKSKTDRIFSRVARVASTFRKRFTTEEFVQKFSARFPVSWRYLERKYAPSGKGAGHPYTAASRVSQMLRHLARQGQITRHRYVPASPSWGNPVVRTWRS
jgi:hypothetical protein